MSDDTDWNRFDALTDEEIDTSEIPPLGKAFFENARLRMPGSAAPSELPLDMDVAEWLCDQDEDWRTLANSVLREYMQSHKSG